MKYALIKSSSNHRKHLRTLTLEIEFVRYRRRSFFKWQLTYETHPNKFWRNMINFIFSVVPLCLLMTSPYRCVRQHVTAHAAMTAVGFGIYSGPAREGLMSCHQQFIIMYILYKLQLLCWSGYMGICPLISEGLILWASLYTPINYAHSSVWS